MQHFIGSLPGSAGILPASCVLSRRFRAVFEHALWLGVIVWLIASTAAGSKMLTGGVEQSEQLPAVTPELTAAVEQAKRQPYVEWFMIPKWMAGEWTKDGDTTVALTDLRTGAKSYPNQWTPNRLVRRFGHRADKAGNIWWANLVPSEKDGETAGMEDKFLIVERKVEKSTAEYVIARTRFLVSEVSPNGREVLQQYQQEALNHYLPLSDGQLENHSYNRVFDRSGRPQRDGELVSKWRRSAPFVDMAERHGINLEQSLNDYLRLHGLAHLMTRPEAVDHRPAPPAKLSPVPGQPTQASPAPVNQTPVQQGPFPL